MKYRMLRDFYVVWLSQVWEERPKSLITSPNAMANNNAPVNALEQLEDDHELRRRYGTVMELPLSFSDSMVEIIDPGSPQPRRYVGHDWIEQQHQQGKRGYRDHENPQDRYYPSTFERYECITRQDIAKLVDVQVGDTIYFEPRATDVERYLGPYKEGHMFSIRVDEILCKTKRSPIFISHQHHVQEKIYPQGGWVFVQISMEDWKDITTPSGIIMKVAPEALPLRGKCIAAQNKKLEKMEVLFEIEADAPIEIDGRSLTCMREDDILATLKSK
jgi:co-chaperonin GroES (HSP10)